MLTPLSDALTPLYYSKTCLNILRGTICDRSIILPQYIFHQLLLQISMTQILLTLVHLEKSMMISVCMIVLSHHLFFLKLWPKDFSSKDPWLFRSPYGCRLTLSLVLLGIYKQARNEVCKFDVIWLLNKIQLVAHLGFEFINYNIIS